MTGMLKGFALPLLMVLVCFLTGCGGSDGSKSTLAPVSGRVFFKNEGVTAGEIYFLPDASKGTQGDMASAVLQEDGSFTLETARTPAPVKGVAPGSYKVTILLGRRPEKELAKFRKVETTPLTCEVLEEGLPNLVIKLDDYPDKELGKPAKKP